MEPSAYGAASSMWRHPTAIDDDNTRVELRHHGLARHGEGWEGAATGLEAGWPLYLHRFRQLCAT